MECTMCNPYVTIPFLELESDDVVAEFLLHPLPGTHTEGTVYILLEFLQTTLIYLETVKI